MTLGRKITSSYIDEYSYSFIRNNCQQRYCDNCTLIDVKLGFPSLNGACKKSQKDKYIYLMKTYPHFYYSDSILLWDVFRRVGSVYDIRTPIADFREMPYPRDM